MSANVWDISSNYKKTHKVSYEVATCMPPRGTIVINSLEQADVVKSLKGMTYFPISKMLEGARVKITQMGTGRNSTYEAIWQLARQGRAYVVSSTTPVVIAGTIGEMWTTDLNKLMRTYTFLQSGHPVQITPQLIKQRSNGETLPWTVIKTAADKTENYACFVPVKSKGQLQTAWGAVLNINGAGVSHGKGDFVVMATQNGKPNPSDRWVVNGLIFASTYATNNFGDCIAAGGTRKIRIADLPLLSKAGHLAEEFAALDLSKWLHAACAVDFIDNCVHVGQEKGYNFFTNSDVQTLVPIVQASAFALKSASQTGVAQASHYLQVADAILNAFGVGTI